MRENYKYNKMRDEIGKCELCGSRRDLEMHHIIPLSLIEDNPYVDTEENLLCVCSKCHALLTPRKVLTSIGVRKAQKKYNDINSRCLLFYETINKYTEKTSQGERTKLSAADVLDIFDKIFL